MTLVSAAVETSSSGGRTAAATAAPVVGVVAFIGVYIAYIWLGELPTTLAILGGIVALGGVIYAGTTSRRRVPRMPKTTLNVYPRCFNTAASRERIVSRRYEHVRTEQSICVCLRDRPRRADRRFAHVIDASVMPTIVPLTPTR